MRPSKNAIPLDGIPQLPTYLVRKFNEVERYKEGTVVFTDRDHETVRTVIREACSEIIRRRIARGLT